MNIWEKWQKGRFKSKALHFGWELGLSFIWWQVWLERNARIFRETFTTLDGVWQTIWSKVTETVAVHAKEEAQIDIGAMEECTELQEEQDINCWKPPPEGWIKINTDGAAKGNPGRAGIGVVRRNHVGTVLYWELQGLGRTTNNEAEAIAIKSATVWAVKHGHRKIILESDSQIMVGALDCMRNFDLKAWRLRALVTQIKELWKELEDVIPVYVSRDLNKAADFLAKMGAEKEVGAQLHSDMDIEDEVIRQGLERSLN